MNPRSKKILLAAVSVAALALAFAIIQIQKPGRQTETGSPIVASFYPVQFFAQQIAGPELAVYSITPSGVEPHDFEPTPRDIARLQSADVVVVNGGGLEPWFEKIKPELEQSNVTVVVAGAGLTTEQFTDEDGEKAADPHVWLDPVAAASMVDAIEKGLSAAKPSGRMVFSANAAQLKEIRLADLHHKFETGLMNCRHKQFVTAHAAFGYLAKRYGLTQVAIAGLSPESEPTAQELRELTNFVRRSGIRVIFFESLTSPKLSETLAKEVGAETKVLNPLEGLTAEETATGADYFSIMEQNLANLKIALECPTR